MKKKTLSKNEINVLGKSIKLLNTLQKKSTVAISKLKSNSLVTESCLLTFKEIRIVKLICAEYTNKEIASKMDLSQRTIEGIRTTIMVKTKSKSAIGLFRYSLKNGIYSLK